MSMLAVQVVVGSALNNCFGFASRETPLMGVPFMNFFKNFQV